VGPASPPPYTARFRTREQLKTHIKTIDLGTEPEEMRAAFKAMMMGQPPGKEEVIGGLSGLSVGSGPLKAIWLHGGGYVFGGSNTHTMAASYLADEIDGRIFLPDYRLGPENSWPAPFEDAMTVVGSVDHNIALIGDSAGGHLAIQSALRLPDKISHLILFSPNTDRTGRSDTRQRNSASDMMNDDETDDRLFRMAIPDLARTSPEASPILADLTHLPPTTIFVGGDEVLLGDALLFRSAAQKFGRKVDLQILEGESHMFWQWPDIIPAAKISFIEIREFIEKT